MCSNTMCTRHLLLCAAIILGAVSSAAAAAPGNAGGPALQRCINNQMSSGRGFGGDDEVGTTAYDSLVGYCMERTWRGTR
jgi:hypothetical protein